MTQPIDMNDEPTVDTVTRHQEGQFIDEGGETFAPNLEETALAGETEAQLLGRDSSSVHALQVNMERSGADYIQAQKSFLTNSGAREVHSDSARMTQSGVLTLNAETVEMKQSSAVIANAKAIELHESRIGIGVADEVQIHESSNVGMLIGGDVDAKGDIRSFMLIGGNVNAGGNVTTTLNAQTAGIAAGVFAIALVLFGRLFGRKG